MRLIGTYLGIIVISLAVFLVIPEKNFAELGRVDQNGYQNAELAAQQIYEAAQEGRLDQVEGLQINGHRSFEFSGDRLQLVNQGAEPLNMMIIAERTDINEGKIEMLNYKSTTVLAGLDFTDILSSPPEAALSGNQLTIKGVGPKEVKLYRSKDFVINQFRRESEGNDSRFSGNVFGHQVLKLTIPRHVQIDDAALGTNVIMID